MAFPPETNIDCPRCHRHLVLSLSPASRCPYCRALFFPETQGTQREEEGGSAEAEEREEWRQVSGHPDLVESSLGGIGSHRMFDRTAQSSHRISALHLQDNPDSYYHPLSIFRRAIQRSQSFSRCQTRLLDSLFSEYEEISAVPYLRSVVEREATEFRSFEELLRALAVGSRPTDQETLQRLSPQKVTSEMAQRRDSCAICQEAFKCQEFFRGLPCTHCFHCVCIEPWLHVKNSCPVCRLPVH